MAKYKAPDFNERAALAKAAKQRALDELKAKPPLDEAMLAERRAAREAKATAADEKRRAKLQAEKEAASAEEALRLAAGAAAATNEAELKAARDARYAARKARKGR